MSFHITNLTIKKDWTDYNNHMNMAYYVLVFDQTWEIILEKFKMGEKSAKDTQRSTMVVETREFQQPWYFFGYPLLIFHPS